MSRYDVAADYFARNPDRWISPTEIGKLFDGHSSIGSPICRRLALSQVVERNEKGHYKYKERGGRDHE